MVCSFNVCISITVFFLHLKKQLFWTFIEHSEIIFSQFNGNVIKTDLRHIFVSWAVSLNQRQTVPDETLALWNNRGDFCDFGSWSVLLYCTVREVQDEFCHGLVTTDSIRFFLTVSVMTVSVIQHDHRTVSCCYDPCLLTT